MVMADWRVGVVPGERDVPGGFDGGAAEERRRVERVRVERMTSRVSCRILPGGGVTLVDVSAYGVLFESSLPLGPGRAVHLQMARLEPGCVPVAYQNVDGCVIRCAVVALCAIRGPIYRVGVLLEVSLWETFCPSGATGVLRVRSPVEDFAVLASRARSGGDPGAFRPGR